MGAPGNISKHF